MSLKDRIYDLFHKNPYTLPILQGLGIIALVTLISAVSVKILTGDTLSDYAQANPELAYGKTEAEPASEEGAEPAPESANAAVIDDEPEVTGEVNETEQAPSDSLLPEYNRSAMIHFYDPMVDSESRNTYKPGFYYEALNDEIREYITGTSYPGTDDMVVSYDDLAYVGLLYIDFDGLTQAGEIICNKLIAQDLTEIFYELYISDYRIDSVRLIDNYGADDIAGASADNTSCFNYAPAEDTASLSKHAYGMAIDINPYYNPYIEYGAGEGGKDMIIPAGSEDFADRTRSFPYKIDEADLCYRLFKEHGFTWGGDRNSGKDYRHFQKTP